MAELISGRDLRALVAVVEDGRHDEPGPAVPWALLDGLRELLRCDEVSLVELDMHRRGTLIHQSVIDGGERALEANVHYDPEADHLFWSHYRGFHAPVDSTGQVLGVVRWSDVYPGVELRNHPLYAECFIPAGIKHCMTIGLPNLPGFTRRVLLRRYNGADFGDRDKLIAELLRPHIFEVHQEAQRKRDGVPRLTRREWQVLELVAQGHGNADIARLLFTSQATVRKHMEHIFDRTGVRTRGAAVARMLPLAATLPNATRNAHRGARARGA
jgi:DNA-binding CsgD family transcriptional regulator